MYVCVCMVALVCVHFMEDKRYKHHIPTPRARHYVIDMDAVLLGFEEELTAAVQADTRIHQVRTDVNKSLSTRARKHAHTSVYIDTQTHSQIRSTYTSIQTLVSLSHSHTHT